MATIKEIAKLTNVSSSTVSRVLNNDETISVQTDTRNRILEAAKKLGYKTIYERRMEQKRKNKGKDELTVSILLCHSVQEELSDPYFFSIRQGIEEELANLNINTTTFRLYEGMGNQLQHDLDGLIIVGRINDQTLKTVSNHIENVVYVNHSPDSNRYDAVVIDFEKATERALQQFINSGYKSIGYIGGTEREHMTNQMVVMEDMRLTTFIKTMKENNKFNSDNIFIGEYTMAEGYNLMKSALQLPSVPEAFFIASDPMAIGALRALQEVNLLVPEDLAIISFDDIEIAKFASTPLTTVKVHTKEMGRLGVKLLLDRINGREIPLTVTVPTELIIRQSCGTKYLSKN